MRTFLIGLAFLTSVAAAAQDHHHHASPATSNQQPATTRVPDVPVQTHDGREVRFPDLVRRRLTAVNFIFTSCTTVCPLMGVRFAQLQPLLPKDVSLISVSIDPANDTPRRLAEWGARVGAKPGWTLVTGTKPDIDTLLRSLGTAIADPASHTPLVLIIDDRGETPSFQRLDGLTDPKSIAAALSSRASSEGPGREEREEPATSPSHPGPSLDARDDKASARYFANLNLVDQNGEATDLYTLMKGRTIVINSFFASCTATCPVMTGTFNAIQERFADRLGKDLVLVSITVDPKNDTPEKLKSYAKGTRATAGRYFLTGSKEQVDAALKRIGQVSPTPEQHTNVIIVGNEKTGLWKKAFGLAKPEEIVDIVRSVLDDDGTTPAK